MDICIGIISWLPDEKIIRDIRLTRLKDLIFKCKVNFNLDIIIVAQNYKDLDIQDRKVKLYRYDKLGITGAREELRKIFLELDYDYMICFDDDFELNINIKSSKDYLTYLNRYPDCLITYENYLMNLCAISRYIANEYPFDKNISAEKGTGFEDWVWISIIKIKDKDHYKTISKLNLPKKLRKELVNDEYSTWLTNLVDKNDLLNRSRELIVKLSK